MAPAAQAMFRIDPVRAAALVFRPKRADRIKLLIRDQTGEKRLVPKRLKGGDPVWPQPRDAVMRMFSAQFAALS